MRIEGERIVEVGPLDHLTGATVLDAHDATVMPGLVDLHTHFTGERDMELFLRAGVTGVRFAGNPPGEVAALRDRVRRGDVPGPRIFSCGPHVDEPPTAWPGFTIEVSDPERARVATAALLETEADAIIVIQRVRPPTLRAIVATAHERGAPVTGQTWATSVREAVAAGIDGIENTARLPEDPARSAEWLAGYRSIGDRLARLVQLWATAPEGAIDEVLALMAERRVVWTPAVCSFAYWAGLTDEPFDALPGAAWLTEAERAAIRTWRTRVTEGWGAEERGLMPRAIERIQGALARYRALGGTLGVGTDAHPGGLFHTLERAYLRASGLAPAEVLAAATLGGAAALRRDDLGRVEPGALADVVVLEGDPLADPVRLPRVRHVVVGGRVLVEAGELRGGSSTAPTGFSAT